HRRHTHLVRIRRRQESQPKNLKSVDCRGLVQLLADGADHNLPPEAFDRAGRLPLLVEPLPKRDLIQILSRSLLADRQHRSTNVQFLRRIQKPQMEERSRKMQRSRKRPGAHHAAASPRLDENEFAEKLDVIRNAEPLVKILKIDTAPQQDVLAVIDSLLARF